MPTTLVSSDLRFKVSERRENHYGHKPTTLFLICLLSLFGRREKGKWRERERERKEGSKKGRWERGKKERRKASKQASQKLHKEICRTELK